MKPKKLTKKDLDKWHNELIRKDNVNRPETTDPSIPTK